MQTLMFVEDDSILMDVYVRHFQEYEGVKILQAFDGQTAMEILERVQPDVLVTGIHMPKKSGIDILKFIQEKKYTFPVIVLTNQADMRFQKRAFELGATEYLIKQEMTVLKLKDVLDRYLHNQTPAKRLVQKMQGWAEEAERQAE